MNTKKKIKLPSKQNLAEPIEADEVGLRKVLIDFENGSLVADVNMVNSDGGPDGDPRIVLQRPIHIGLGGITKPSIDKFEQDLLEYLAVCGVLPSGGSVQEK